MKSKSERLKRFKTDANKVRARAAKMERNSIFWNAKDGPNRIRIMPPWDESGQFYFESAIHYGFKVDGQNRAYPCLKALGEAKCPTCQVVARYKDEQDKDVKKIIQAIKPKSKFFMNIIDRKAEVAEVKIYGAGFKVASAILGYYNDDDAGYGDITDPEEGRDIIITRSGKGMYDTDYDVKAVAKPSHIDLDGWEDLLHDLKTESFREVIDGATMLEMLTETYPMLDLDGITAKSGTAVSKKKAKPVEEEPEEEEEEEEEEAAPPPKKKAAVATKKAKPAEDDDDNLEIEDDEDED